MIVLPYQKLYHFDDLVRLLQTDWIFLISENAFNIVRTYSQRHHVIGFLLFSLNIVFYSLIGEWGLLCTEILDLFVKRIKERMGKERNTSRPSRIVDLDHHIIRWKNLDRLQSSTFEPETSDCDCWEKRSCRATRHVSWLCSEFEFRFTSLIYAHG